MNGEFVGVQGDQICSIKLRFAISRERAINLAAWLIALAQGVDPERDAHDDFEKEYQAAINS